MFFKIIITRILAARIGKVAFLEPEIKIEPDRVFFPLIKSFA